MRALTEENVIYAYSHCETWMETYCKSHSLSYDELAERVVGIFSSLKRPGEVIENAKPNVVPDVSQEYQFSPGAVAEYKRQGKQDYKSNETQVTTSLDPIDREIKRSFKWVKCKYCPKKMRSTDMANHIRYAHHSKVGKTAKIAKTGRKNKRRKLSPKVIKMMRENLAKAREARWGKKKKKKTRRYFSPEGIERIREAKKNYWKERKEREQREEQRQQEEKKANQTLQMPEQETIAS